jgi:hypothetical protein
MVAMRPQYTVEHPPERRARSASCSARRAAAREAAVVEARAAEAVRRGWNRPGIPPNFSLDAQAELGHWEDQQAFGSKLQDVLERALELHKNTGAPLHRVSLPR